MTLAYIAIILLAILFFATFLKGAPYAPSSDDAVESMVNYLKERGVTRVVDLGSGDGRILMALAREGIKAEGFEINPLLVVISEAKIRRAGLKDSAHVYWKDFWKSDLSHYDGVTVFGAPHIMEKLEHKLSNELKQGTTIASHMYKMPALDYYEDEDNRIYFYHL